MKKPPKRRESLAVAILTLCLAIAAAVFPLVFSDNVVRACVRLLEVLAQLG